MCYFNYPTPLERQVFIKQIFLKITIIYIPYIFRNYDIISISLVADKTVRVLKILNCGSFKI